MSPLAWFAHGAAAFLLQCIIAEHIEPFLFLDIPGGAGSLHASIFPFEKVLHQWLAPDDATYGVHFARSGIPHLQ